MSRRQYGFLVGFLIAWLLWAASLWVTLGAILLGLLGYAIARVIEGDLDLSGLGDLADRIGNTRR
jgi:uncharacterized membrane protein